MRDCQGLETPWPLAFLRKAARHGHQNRTRPIFGGELGENEAGTQRRGGNRDGKKPQGPTGNWLQAEVGKGGSEPEHEC